MAFDKLPHVETPDTYLDIAFGKAAMAASKLRSNIKQEKREKSRTIEMARINCVGDALSTRLNGVVKGFPSFEQLTPFYRELVKVTIDYDELKKSLGMVDWTAKLVTKITTEYIRKIIKANTIDQMNKVRKAYYGRISSIIKDIKKNLKFLIKSRKTIIEYPAVKAMPTICIAGFPNVGKSTLLKNMTRAKPEIKNYAFTTKSLNFGYSTIHGKKIQFIDTPGTLARDKMNLIEMQADIAMQYAATVIVYVWDLTEPYSMKDQEKLFEIVQKFKVPVVEYLSKTDIIEKEKVKEFVSKKNIAINKKELKLMIEEKLKTNQQDQ